MIFKLNKKLGLKLLTKGTYIEDDIEITLNDESYRNLIASNVKEGVKILDVVGTMKNEKPEQEKEVIPSFETQIVLPDNEDYTLGKVTVHPIPDVYIIPEGNIVLEENNKIYNVHKFSTAEVKIPTETLRTELDMVSGNQIINPLYTDYLQQVIVEKPEDLQPDNIKVGKNIGGVEGSYLAPDGWLKPDGTLEIFENGEYEVTSKEFVDVQIPLPSGTITITSEGSHNVYDYENAVVTLPKETIITDLNMVDGDQTIEPTLDGHFLTKVTIEKPEDLQPENIKIGKEIGGVIGTYEAPEGWGEAEGTYLLNKYKLKRIIEDGQQTIYPNEFIDTNIELTHPNVTLNMMKDGKLADYQIVKSEETELFEYINIQRPYTLAPENIKENVIIAGVKGTYVAPDNWVYPEGTHIIDKDGLLDIIANGPHDVSDKEFVDTSINLENPSVELNLADGNQIVNSNSDSLINTLEIEKPITLEPNNIKNDVNIAGVVGTYIAPDGWEGPKGTYDLTKDKLKYIISNGPQDVYPNEFIDTSINLENPSVELNLANGNQIVNSTNEGLFESVEIEKPSTLEPKNIRKDINIAGVIGTLQEPEGEVVLDFTDEKDATKTSFDVFNYATATANFTTTATSKDLLTGQTAYSTDGLIVGSIEEYEGDNEELEVPDTDALREIIERTIEVCNIPNETTKIGIYAFAECDSLTSVIIPETVKKIDNCAFLSCSNLSNINIPNSVTYIGSEAFKDCTKLKNMIIPYTVTTLLGSSFYGCKLLEEVKLYANVKTTHVSAFQGCTSLKKVTLPDYSKFKTIAASAFQECTSLENIEIPDTVTEIELQAFKDCTSLKNILDGSQITTIGSNAFRDCVSFTGFKTYCSSLKTIGSYAFCGCILLEDLNCAPVYSIGNYAFSGDKALKQIDLKYCDSLGMGAFKNCENLEDINYLSDNLEEIPESAFNCCYKLKDFEFPFYEISIEDFAFNNCQSLTNIHINRASLIGLSAFYQCTSVRKIYIGTVETIDNYAFQNCSSLEELEIDSVGTFGSLAFAGCTSLKKLKFKNFGSKTNFRGSLFHGSKNIEIIDFSECSAIPNVVANVLERAFEINSNLQILVPSSLYSEWIKTSSWSYYKNYIKAV